MLRLKSLYDKNQVLFKSLRTYITLVIVLNILVIPIYLQFYGSVKEGVMEDTYNNIKLGMSLLEGELTSNPGLIQSLTLNADYAFIRKIDRIARPGEFLHVESLRKYYKDLSAFMSVQEKSFLIFQNNDIVISRDQGYTDAGDIYATLWEFENHSYHDLKALLFSRGYFRELTPGLNFYDWIFAKTSELVYVTTVAPWSANKPGAVLVSVYDAQKLVQLCQLEEIAQKGLLVISAQNDEECYRTGSMKITDRRAPDLFFESIAADMKLRVYIPAGYYKKRLQSVHRVLSLYALSAALAGIALSFAFAQRQRKPVERILRYLDSYSDQKYNVGDAYEYIEKEVREMGTRSSLAKEQLLLEKLFIKLLLTGLNAAERDEFYKICADIPGAVYLIYLRNYSEIADWSVRLEQALFEKGVRIYRMLGVNEKESVLFIEKEFFNLSAVKACVLSLNRNDGCDIRGAIGALQSDIMNSHIVFQKLKEAIKYLEYDTVMIFEDLERQAGGGDFSGEYAAKGRHLYELLLSGNVFEASCLVYEQWYALKEQPGFNNDIERLFYSQEGILSQVATDVGYAYPTPAFVKDMNIVRLAFSVTAYIEGLCDFINMNKGKGDKRTLQVLEYINENCYNASFYMPELVERFSLSDRSIAQLIKNMTGQTFSSYVNQLRIKRAENLLKSTHLPISEIAAYSGFDSANALYKAFRKSYGVSPSTYRESR